MVTATNNSLENLLKSFNGSSSNKTASEANKTDNTKVTSDNDFKKVLNSKTYSKDQEDSQKADNNVQNESSTETESKTIDEVKEKLKELDDESKSASKDKINDILSELLNLLAKLGIKEDGLNSGAKINADVLKGIIEKINGDTISGNSLNNTIDKIVELLKTDSVKDKLDTDSLKVIANILGNLNDNYKNDNSKDVKSSLKNIMSEISNMLDDKQSESDKVLTLQDMLGKNYSQNNSEDSNLGSSKDSNLGSSKEEKFLKSLVDDNKDSVSNKINLFALRTGTIQNQGANAVTDFTIDKATFTDDLIKDVKFMNANALKELTVKVNPGDLGEITIKLVQEDGLMKADLKANSKETAALLSQNLTEIKKQLSEQNIKISDVNIELYQDDTTFFKEQNFNRQFSREQENKNNGNSNNTINSNVIVDDELAVSDVSSDNNLDYFV